MKPVIVVEGTSDVNRLRNLVDCDFVITNGSAISKDTIEYIKELSKTRRIIVFTDPDYQGKLIRSKIEREVKQVEHCFINKEYAVKGKKLGVCECEKKELLRALNQVLNFKTPYPFLNQTISYNDLMELKLTGYEDSLKRREYISNKIPIGRTNAKTFLKRINQLGVSLKKLKIWMEEYNDSK